MRFTSEIMENGSLSFLDITITRENNTFVTPAYRKPTFSGIFTSFEIFIPDMQKRGSIETLLHRSFRLCSSYKKFHREVETLTLIFKHNNYPQSFVNQCIKKFLNKLFIKKDPNFMVPRGELTLVLPYLRKISLDLRTSLKKIFRAKCTLNTLIRFKDPLEKKIHSGIIYRYTCSNCKFTYYGKTFCYFYTRAAEHMVISSLTSITLNSL